MSAAQLMKAIDEHIRAQPYWLAKGDLETIRGHIEERLEGLTWFLRRDDGKQPPATCTWPECRCTNYLDCG